MKNLWIALILIAGIGASACSDDNEQGATIPTPPIDEATAQIDEATAKAVTSCGEGNMEERAECREMIFAQACADEPALKACIDEIAAEWMLLRIRSAPAAFDDALLAFEEALWTFEDALRIEVNWDAASPVERAIACQSYRALEDPEVRAVFNVLARECA